MARLEHWKKLRGVRRAWACWILALAWASGCTEAPAPAPGDAGGMTDAAGIDSGVNDASESDAWLAEVADGGRHDAEASDGPDDEPHDAGPNDADPPDLGGEDRGLDASGLDAAPDANLPDAASDAGFPDAGPQPIEVEGFGEGTVGGWQAGADSYVVTSLDDDGPGTLREGVRTQGAPRVITFGLDGRVELLSALELPSNLSIDGRGHDAGVRGKGFRIPTGEQIILHNLVIEDVGPNSEDGLQIGWPTGVPPHHLAVDHVWFLQHGDGGDSANVDEAISVIFGAHDLTIAWCRFTAWEKAILAGNGDADAAVDGAIAVTVHHNWFESTGRRHPRARYGRFDVYNNFLDQWHAYDWTWLPPYRDSYGSWCQNDCQMIVENNVYERTPVPEDVLTKANDASRCSEGGRIREAGAYLRPGNTAPLEFSHYCDPNGVVFARPYAITLEPADEALVQRLRLEAGNTR